MATTALLSGFSLLALPAGVLLDCGHGRPLATVTIGLAALAFLLSMWIVWPQDFEGETAWKLFGIVAAFAVSSAQTCATTARRREDDPSSVDVLYLVSVAIAYGLAALVTLAIGGEIDSDGYFRLLGALAVANVLVALLQPIVRRLAAIPPERRDEAPPSATHGPVGGESVFRFRCTLESYPDALPSGDA